LTFNERRDLAVLAAEEQVTFPVARKRTIFDCRGTLADRYRFSDLPVDAALLRRVSRTTDWPPTMPREISSRSIKVNARLDRCRWEGRIPPDSARMPWMDEW